MIQFLFVQLADENGKPVPDRELAIDLSKVDSLLAEGYSIIQSDPDHYRAAQAQIVIGWNLILYKPDDTATISPQQLASEQPTDVYEIVEVAHYLSNSGNPTWKAITYEGEIIYLRQAYKKQLQEAKLWDVLNQMFVGDTWPVNEGELKIHAYQDGDFLRPAAYEGFLLPPLDDCGCSPAAESEIE